MTEYTTNTVRIYGTVEAEPKLDYAAYGEEFYIAYIRVSRLSGAHDIVPVTLSSGSGIEYQALQVGTTVIIEGEIRSYNTAIKGPHYKSRLIVSVFAKRCEPASAIAEEDTNNYVEIVGYLCKAPNYRVTPRKREIADLLIAINRPNDKSSYVPVVAWGHRANFARKLSVGDKAKIIGRFQSREYEKQLDDGSFETRTTYEVSTIRIYKEKEE
jgi:single-stranded DNA-binding protein